MLLVSTAAIGLILALAPANALTARAIIEKTHEAAGGAAWRRAVTNVMRGHATLYYNGAKEVDIRWTSAAIGEPIPKETFVLGRKTP